MVEHKLLRLMKIHTKENLTDMFIKVVAPENMKLCKNIVEIDGSDY